MSETEDEGKIKKICPVMTSGNGAFGALGIAVDPSQRYRICVEEKCGVWNDISNQCGFIARP